MRNESQHGPSGTLPGPDLPVTSGRFAGSNRTCLALAAVQSGNFSARSIARKHGSLRSGSKKKFIFVYARYGSRLRIAVSSSRARGRYVNGPWCVANGAYDAFARSTAWASLYAPTVRNPAPRTFHQLNNVDALAQILCRAGAKRSEMIY
jgi:hypothetical protein